MYPNENICCGIHTNGFIDLNDQPFLLAEYLDRRSIQTIDRALIQSSIDIDTHEPMKTVVDISIDDIGKRADGTPKIIGNNTKQRMLIDMIAREYRRLDHQLPVLNRGIKLCIQFQLENNHTGKIIRSGQENIIIPERLYFLDVNPRDVNDNAIITNFATSAVSTLSSFTHGRDKMQLRITQVQMYYQLVSSDPVYPCPEQMPLKMPGPFPTPVPYDSMGSYYEYHNARQQHHYIGDYGMQPPEALCPPDWDMFNRLYHFENRGRDIVLHYEEINNHRNRVIDIPCGFIHVNRIFMVQPGARIVWKFSVWKNDVTAVNDTTTIARALKAPYYPSFDPCHPGGCYNDPSQVDYDQNVVINQIASAVNNLAIAVNDLKNGTSSEEPTEPVEPIISDLPTKPSGEHDCPCPPYPPRPPHPPCPPPPPPHPHRDPIKKLFKEINDIKSEITNINDEMAEDIPDRLPIADVDDIMQDAISAVPDEDDTIPPEDSDSYEDEESIDSI